MNRRLVILICAVALLQPDSAPRFELQPAEPCVQRCATWCRQCVTTLPIRRLAQLLLYVLCWIGALTLARFG